MRMKSNAVFGLVSPILFALVVAISPSIANSGPGQGQTTAAPAVAATGPQVLAPGPRSFMIRLADAHSDACLWNYNNCMKGCDGATSCSAQCKVNYDNCMRQAG
jgi:hypothetical protein